MTTIIPFIQPPNEPFQFQPTLDGQVYNASVPWGLFGQRYYLSLSSLGGALVFYLPLIGSDTAINIESMSWLNGQVTVETIDPHGYVFASTVELTISGCSPSAYNMQAVRSLIISDTEFTYPIQADPGEVTTLGRVSYDVNLAGGYFQTSTLVFRQDAQQFEVTP